MPKSGCRIVPLPAPRTVKPDARWHRQIWGYKGYLVVRTFFPHQAPTKPFLFFIHAFFFIVTGSRRDHLPEGGRDWVGDTKLSRRVFVASVARRCGLAPEEAGKNKAFLASSRRAALLARTVLRNDAVRWWLMEDFWHVTEPPGFRVGEDLFFFYIPRSTTVPCTQLSEFNIWRLSLERGVIWRWKCSLAFTAFPLLRHGYNGSYHSSLLVVCFQLPSISLKNFQESFHVIDNVWIIEYWPEDLKKSSKLWINLGVSMDRTWLLIFRKISV